MKDDNRICADCVTEPYLRAEVARSGNVGKRCDYCGQKAPTFGMGEVAERCNRVIEMFYTLTSMTPAVVYFGRTPRGEGLLDIVGRWLTQEYDAPAYDLQEVLLARWDDGEGGKYGDEDPWFVRARASGWQLDAAWTRMERSLREEARLVNPVVVQTLEKVFSGLLDDRTQNGESVIIEIGPERPVDTLFRARVFETQESLEHALQHPERELGPPCPALATAGRMNARGVSVFYGAIEANTAIREVRPPVGSDVVVAAFKVLRPLRLLNLTALSHARADPSLSLFDPATTDIVERCDFLNTLEDILTMPIMPAFTEGGYLITQAVSDFLSTHPHLDLDGIYFRSVQSRGNRRSRHAGSAGRKTSRSARSAHLLFRFAIRRPATGYQKSPARSASGLSSACSSQNP
ncbi:RES domain-containing protein [Burkholderia sp. Bp8995]|nr:RES domain-containing protein [Burkholderia sp. Bp8995]